MMVVLLLVASGFISAVVEQDMENMKKIEFLNISRQF